MKVQLLGWVVGIERKSGHLLLELEDGTASLSCIYWLPKDSPLEEGEEILCLGELVHIFGKVGHYCNQVQVTILDFVKIVDPNRLTLWHLEVMHLKRSVYTKILTS